MISVYTNYNLIEECENKNYLFPLIKLLVENNEVLNQEYQISTEIKKAHVAIFPIAVDFFLRKRKNKKILQHFIDCAVRENKKIIVFTSGDIGLTINQNNVYTLRLGGFASKIKEKGWIMPPFINDPYFFLQKEETYLNKKTKPEIGFVGHSNGSFVKLIKEFLLYVRLNFKRIIGAECVDYQSFYPSSFFRYHFLIKLQNNNAVITRFIFRKKYRAGVINETEKHKTSVEFYDNIYNNLYTFCMRGGGNFSVRLYETLAMGRIPIVIDTDCKYPFEKTIDWQKHCISIKNREKRQLVQKIVQYHEKHSDTELITIQKENRLLWQEYATEANFFLKFKNEILKII